MGTLPILSWVPGGFRLSLPRRFFPAAPEDLVPCLSRRLFPGSADSNEGAAASVQAAEEAAQVGGAVMAAAPTAGKGVVACVPMTPGREHPEYLANKVRIQKPPEHGNLQLQGSPWKINFDRAACRFNPLLTRAFANSPNRQPPGGQPRPIDPPERQDAVSSESFPRVTGELHRGERGTLTVPKRGIFVAGRA